MYVKITKAKEHKYLQIVQSYRDQKNNVRHKVLLHLGRLDRVSKQSLLNIATKLLELAGVNKGFTLKDLGEAEILNWGYIVYKKIWDKFKLEDMLQGIQRSTGKSVFELNNASFLMVIRHLLAPGSKLNAYNKQRCYAELPEVELNHLYRSLDILSDNKEAIELHIFNMNCKMFNIKVDVSFYDVTTFHFESVKKDSLKDFGFSKANKVNEVQVVLGMLTDCEGLPIGYELFSGNTFEGKTLKKALDAIEKRFNIRNVIIVADRGINSKLNLKQITDKGYGYIVASRIKNLKKDIQERIFDDVGYQMLEDKECIRYKVIDYLNSFKNQKELIKLAEKMIITYSEKRAEKDRNDRKRLLEKTEYLLANKSMIKANNKRGGKKYLKEIGNTDWVLDEAALIRDEKFDGYYAIQTSEQNLDVEKVLDAYHSLWKIEESFRIMKSTLEVRPIFHWTENRIKGHFVICFLAFLLERTLEFKLKENQIEATPDKIREALNNMQFAVIDLNDQKLFVRTKDTELGSNILRTLRIKQPKSITMSPEFDN
jgi:transposase